MRIRLAARLLVSILFVSTCAHAVGLRFLKDAPVANFTEEDFRLQREAVEAVLESTEPSAERTWRNEKSGNHGSVKLLSSSTVAQQPCRRIRVESYARGRKGASTWNVCRTENGDWRVDTSPQSNG